MSRPPRIIAIALGLVLALPALSAAGAASAAGPIAARPTTTTVSGFPKTTKRVDSGQKVVFKVKINDNTRARRVVRLQKKVSGAWRNQIERRTNPRGVVRFAWKAPTQAKTTRLRIVAPRARRSRGTTTAARRIVTSPPTTTATPAQQSRADRYEAKVFELLNVARSQARVCGGSTYPAAGPLTRNVKLDRAARKFAQRMADEKFFDHVAPNGDTPTDRAQAEGYRGGVGENIAAGYSTPVAVTNGWLNSPGHCANLMSRGYRVVGIGFAVARPGASAPFSDYWVQDFG